MMNLLHMIRVLKCRRSRPSYSRRRKRERRPTTTTTSIDSLPDDLLFLILVCLPADYLHDIAKFVCSRWYNIIHSHSFINAHYQHSSYCLLFPYDYCSSNYEHRIIWMMTATSQGLIQTTQFSYVSKKKFLGTCNGLILVRDKEKDSIDLQIINPVTKQVFLLPPFCVPETDEKLQTNYGIAYAAASMQYKVVISYNYRFPTSSPSGIVILTVGVDNCWRQVLVDINYNEPLLTEGFIHWVDYDRKEGLVTLDVETEILSQVPSPSLNDVKYHRDYLSTGKSLSMLLGRGLGRRFLSLWEMNPKTKEWMMLVDDIMLGSQLQQQRLQQLGIGSNEYLLPQGWIKYPKVLVFSVHDPTKYDVVISYNLDTHEINSTEFSGPRMFLGYTDSIHKNSLLWLT